MSGTHIKPYTDEELLNLRRDLNGGAVLAGSIIVQRLLATIDQMRVDQEPRTTDTLKKAAEIIRKKVKSIRDWGWDPSGDDESRRRGDARNEANESVRRAMDDIADALEEAVQ